MTSRRILPTILAFLFAVNGLGLVPRPAAAQSGSSGGATPPRLAFVNGEVSFWRTGADDWSQAQVNTALAAGDSLYAGDAANLELEVGPRAFVRAGADTEIDLTALDPTYTQLRMTGGHSALDLKALPRGQSIEVDTPNGAFTINRPGYYRLDVDENRTAFSARRGGTATVMPAAGETSGVVDNQEIILEGTDTVQVNVTAAPAPDEWDRWNYDRTAQLSEAPRSAQYVPPDIAGVDDLDRYGDWREQPRYGHVWVPRDVRPDWAPYSTGRWVYDPTYEWTWVDDSPWGWAPYHYGRWVNFDGVWGWAPGPVVRAPVYSPALVAFFGAPGIGVSVGVGLPFVSWCALGFGEPIIPWWGHRGFVGRPYWGGWGGPRIVNNVVINNTTIVNVRNVTRFQNVNIRNAVVAVDRNQFGRGRVEHVQLDAQRLQRLQPVRGDLRVRPVPASLAPREARGPHPPERLQARQVVATRPPQDSARRLQAKGFAVPATARRPEPRIVGPQRGPGSPAARPQAGVRAEGAAAPGGRQPPPVPGAPRPGAVGAAQPGRPTRAERPQPGAPGASGRAMPPPPPGGDRARQRPAGRVQQAPPPVPGGQGSGSGAASHPERPARPQAPQQERRAPQQPPPPPHAAPPARAVPPPPSRPHAAPQERVAPPQPARPQVPQREQMVPQERARPHAPPPERAAPPQPARQQAPPQERAVPQQPARPQAAPREPAAQRQPAPRHPAAGERKSPEAPQQQR